MDGARNWAVWEHLYHLSLENHILREEVIAASWLVLVECINLLLLIEHWFILIYPLYILKPDSDIIATQ